MRNDASSIPELVVRLAEADPQLPLFRFLANGEAESDTLTSASLHRDSVALSFQLLDVCRPGDRVLLLAPPGLDFLRGFFAIQYAGLIATTSMPGLDRRSDRNLNRLQSIVQSCRPSVSLVSAEYVRLAEQLGVRSIEISSADPGVALDSFQLPSIEIDSPAFLQYTSGSTSDPRGVVLTHRNLLSNLDFIARRFGHHSNSVGVIWLPPYHDMGLIGGILQPLYAGFPVILMSPMHVLQRPVRWLEAISKYGGTTSGGPNFIYDHCVDAISEETVATLDLRTWSVAFCGSETVRPAMWRRFSAKFAPAGFRASAFFPCYGLAESTLMVTGGHITSESDCIVKVTMEDHKAIATEYISCGLPDDDTLVAIVDPFTRQVLEDGKVGEITTTGPSVALGYWDAPESTQAVFEKTSDKLANRLFTGDLGFIKNRQLYITGRTKDLIILNGRNYYPQDLELCVESSHAELMPNGTCAFSIESVDRESLVVLAEMRPGIRKLSPSAQLDLLASIRRNLSIQFDVAAKSICLVRAGSIPRTTSGKKRRSYCRSLFEAKHFHSEEIAIAEVGRTLSERGIQNANQQSLRLQRRFAWIMVVTPVLGLIAAIVFSWGRGVQAIDLCCLAMMYILTVLGVEVGLHRLFSHRSFKASEPVRWCLGVLGSMAAQGPVLFWVSTHRRHHAFSDQADDPHSPNADSNRWFDKLKGLWHAHIGWLFKNQMTDPMHYAPDVFRDRLAFRLSQQYPLWVIVGIVLPGLGVLAMTGELVGLFRGMLWGGLVRIFLVHHATWSVNSICHAYGERAFATRDDSRNNAWLALSSLGGSWHNNHHAFPASAYTGFRFWEIDPSGWLIRSLSWLGLVWEANRPTREERLRKQDIPLSSTSLNERSGGLDA